MSALSAAEPGTATRLAAFAGLSALAAWRYASIEARPPALRVIALTAVAIGAGAALTVIRAPEGAPPPVRRRAAIVRAISAVVLLVIALLVAGVPARLLAPGGWAALARNVHQGLGSVSTTLWPYTGEGAWTRLDILLGLAVVPVAAAVLGFWPARRGAAGGPIRLGVRRLGALVLLLALYVTGEIDSNGGSATIEGLALLLLVVGWLWLPGLRRRRALAALGWLAVAGGLAAVLTVNAGGRAWFDYRAWNLFGAGTASTAFSWDQTYGPIRWSRSERTMFTVRSRVPGLWKVTTLDRFDGLRFARSGSGLASVGDLPLPLDDHWYQFAKFTIHGLSSTLLPTEQGATTAVTLGTSVRYEQDGTVRTVGRRLRSGDSYTVMSYVPRPTPTELRDAPRAFPSAYLRYTAFDLPAPEQSGLRLAATDPPRPGRSFTDRTIAAPAPGVPPSASPRLRRQTLASPYGPLYRLARELASGKRSPYDVALAVQTYLKANYAYSEQVPPRRYPLESFLFSDRAGYCQQFSGAMALMLRMDGIPARVAAGFRTGAYDSSTGFYRVPAVAAHSWVEVFFSGIGWIPFDPTPPRSTKAIAPRPLFASESAASPPEAIAATVGSLPQYARQRIPIAPRRATNVTASIILLLAAAGAGLLVTVLLAARWLVGCARLRRSLAGDAELATVELALALRRLGYAVPATVTLEQIELLVRAHGGPDAARYVRLLRDRRFAREADQALTLRQRRRLRRALTAHLGLDARLRGHWALPPATVAWGVAYADRAGGP